MRSYLLQSQLMTASILIFEKRSRWRPSLQRELGALPISIRACGTFTELQTSLTECRAKHMQCLAIIDMSGALSNVLQFLERTQFSLPNVPSIVIGTTAHAVLEPTLRELGASAFHQLPLRRDRLAAECLRLLGISQ